MFYFVWYIRSSQKNECEILIIEFRLNLIKGEEDYEEKTVVGVTKRYYGY
jgi:hypothetical protein